MTSMAPWLQVDDADAALEFYRRAWGAVVLERLDDGGHVAVAQLSVDGAVFWVQTGGAPAAEAPDDPPVRMILTVADPHAAHAAAVGAGATEIFPVGEGNGWLVGRVVDPFGHQWEVGHRLPE